MTFSPSLAGHMFMNTMFTIGLNRSALHNSPASYVIVCEIDLTLDSIETRAYGFQAYHDKICTCQLLID